MGRTYFHPEIHLLQQPEHQPRLFRRPQPIHHSAYPLNPDDPYISQHDRNSARQVILRFVSGIQLPPILPQPPQYPLHAVCFHRPAAGALDGAVLSRECGLLLWIADLPVRMGGHRRVYRNQLLQSLSGVCERGCQPRRPCMGLWMAVFPLQHVLFCGKPARQWANFRLMLARGGRQQYRHGGGRHLPQHMVHGISHSNMQFTSHPAQLWSDVGFSSLLLRPGNAGSPRKSANIHNPACHPGHLVLSRSSAVRVGGLVLCLPPWRSGWLDAIEQRGHFLCRVSAKIAAD